MADSPFQRGVALLGSGDPEGALLEFNRSLSTAMGAQKADSLYNVAICHVRLGDIDRALRAIEEAVSADPALATEIEVDPDFRSLANDPRFMVALAKTGGSKHICAKCAAVDDTSGAHFVFPVGKVVASTFNAWNAGATSGWSYVGSIEIVGEWHVCFCGRCQRKEWRNHLRFPLWLGVAPLVTAALIWYVRYPELWPRHDTDFTGMLFICLAGWSLFIGLPSLKDLGLPRQLVIEHAAQQTSRQAAERAFGRSICIAGELAGEGTYRILTTSEHKALGRESTSK
jgi:hypothetical protein